MSESMIEHVARAIRDASPSAGRGESQLRSQAISHDACLDLARAAIEAIPGTWPADAEYQYGDTVEKFTGEARWVGVIVSAYLTTKGSLRYVVEVEPQGFQMIAVPAQLRLAAFAEPTQPKPSR